MKVVVVGAGYAGTMAANRLARKVRSAEITVVSPRPHFVERVRLHQQLSGTGSAATPLAAMLRPGITTRIGAVGKIGDGTAVLAGGEQIDFDHAFLAVGSTVRPMPGTVPVGSWEGAEQARAALSTLPAGGAVTVIGGGPTGIETAAEVAGARPDVRVRLIGPAVAGCFSGAARARVRAGLERLRVDIVDGAAGEVAAGAVRLTDGTEFASDLALWAIVGGIPDLAARSGLEVDGDGRAIVDEYLRSVRDERIFVVGDCAAVPGARLSCQAAVPQGAHAADTLARIVHGRRPRPYSMGYVALGVSLGRRDAVGQFTHRDDTPRRAYLAGRTAVLVKEAASRGARYGAGTGRGAWMPGPN